MAIASEIFFEICFNCGVVYFCYVGLFQQLRFLHVARIGAKFFTQTKVPERAFA